MELVVLQNGSKRQGEKYFDQQRPRYYRLDLMLKFVFRPGFSKELRMKSRRQRASIVYMLNLFFLDKDSMEIKRTAFLCYGRDHLPCFHLFGTCLN